MDGLNIIGDIASIFSVFLIAYAVLQNLFIERDIALLKKEILNLKSGAIPPDDESNEEIPEAVEDPRPPEEEDRPGADWDTHHDPYPNQRELEKILEKQEEDHKILKNIEEHQKRSQEIAEEQERLRKIEEEQITSLNIVEHQKRSQNIVEHHKRLQEIEEDNKRLRKIEEDNKTSQNITKQQTIPELANQTLTPIPINNPTARTSKIIEAYHMIKSSIEQAKPSGEVERVEIQGYVSEAGMEDQLMKKEMEIFQKRFKSEMDGVIDG